MLRLIVGACAVVAMLSSCSSGGAGPSASAQGAPNPSSVLEKLTEDKMCALITKASVERAFDTAVEGAKGTKRGKLPMYLTFECDYDTKGIPSLSTDVTTIDQKKSDQQMLDGVFTDVSTEDRKVGSYQTVAGLGTLAGFGADPLLHAADVAASKLGVVAVVGGERLLLTVRVTGRTDLTRAQPLAEELLTNLKTAVG